MVNGDYARRDDGGISGWDKEVVSWIRGLSLGFITTLRLRAYQEMRCGLRRDLVHITRWSFLLFIEHPNFTGVWKGDLFIWEWHIWGVARSLVRMLRSALFGPLLRLFLYHSIQHRHTGGLTWGSSTGQIVLRCTRLLIIGRTLFFNIKYMISRTRFHLLPCIIYRSESTVEMYARGRVPSSL